MESYGRLIAEGVSLGFNAVGIARAEALPEAAARLRSWLGKGAQADMDYMARNVEKREDIRLLVEGARSVIVTLTNYYTPCKQPDGIPRIARYAYGKDYHIVVKERLRQLMGQMEGRCFVDSAPVLEHEWAKRAGLGWLGKNTLLINKKWGSFCFIGVIVTTTEFDTYSTPFENNYCGACTRCIEACPTGALSDCEVDARKCISYNTIENKGTYPEILKKRAGGRIFGCDICQEVCPWNKVAQMHNVPEFMPDNRVMQLTAADWQGMDASTFLQLFKNTPFERSGLDRLKQNIPESVKFQEPI